MGPIDIHFIAEVAAFVSGVFLLAAGLGKWLHRQMEERSRVLWSRIDELRAQGHDVEEKLADYKLSVAKEYATVQALAEMRRDMDDRFIRMETLIRSEIGGVQHGIERLSGMLMHHAPRAE